MIAFKKIRKYCCEDISLIENYEQAFNDQSQVWECHHRLEIELGLSKTELIKQGLYWNRPASELIFLTPSEHRRVHRIGKPSLNKGKYPSAETRAKIGTKSRGRRHTIESRTKISKATSGINHPQARAVYQIDKNTGVIIKKWDYINEASKKLGINQSNIIQCCRGNHKYKSTGGFRWRYVD